MLLTIILFALGFILLIVGANFLVNGSVQLARRLKISEFLIGLTIVAAGTSAPELVVNIAAGINAHPEIAIGNVLGSNIINALLIVGLAALLRPVKVSDSKVFIDLYILLGVMIILCLLALDSVFWSASDSLISRWDGIVLLGLFFILLFYMIRKGHKTETTEVESSKWPAWKSLGAVLVGLAGLIIGGHWIVEGAVWIASSLGLSQSIIALTVVAIGTSLPELATSVVAARKGQGDIAIANVIGSNIFNILFILGSSAVILPLPFSQNSYYDLIFNLLSTIALFLVLFFNRKYVVRRREGAFLIVIYLAYLFLLLAVHGNFFY